MLHENEFELLRETFQKSRVRIIAASPDSTVAEILDDTIRTLFAASLSAELTLQDAFGAWKPRVLYRFKDNLSLLYMGFMMATEESKEFIIIGPYTDEPLGNEYILEICERNRLAPQNQRIINDFFASVPAVPENSALFLLLDTFCERLWHGEYEISDLQNGPPLFENVAGMTVGEKNIDDTFLEMKNMERRYQMENDIIDAVARGSEHKVNQLFASFGEGAFEKRLADPLRNSKNYGIIMNTLLRKAAERGGVHPVYLDKISSKFAIAIEQVSVAVQARELMADMLRSYCKLVRQHATKTYSSTVKKAVVAIETDPSAELNLHTLAHKLNVSKAYLSTVFKKETGKTVTEYIREKRMSYAVHLLSSTNLQIQTVALHCGMVDVPYFSKLFKQYTGKTPTEFRAELNGAR